MIRKEKCKTNERGKENRIHKIVAKNMGES